MDEIERELRRAARTTPAPERGRRTDHLARALSGRAGAGAAVFGWLLLAGLVVAAFFLGGVVLLAAIVAFAVVAVALARAGAPSHWSHWLMVTSLVVGAACAGFAWWATGVFIDAADTGAPVPAITSWSGPSLIALLCCVIAFWVSVVVGVRRGARTARR